MVRRVTGPWNAVALPEILAGALQESKLGSLGDGGQTGEQQASNCGQRRRSTRRWNGRSQSEV